MAEAWFWVAIAGPFIVTLAFLWFCLVLVALAIGIIDPHSTPGAEWRRVWTLTSRVIDWWNGR